MAKICQIVLDELGMPVEWALSIVVPIFEEKADIHNCNCYRALMLTEHGMNEGGGKGAGIKSLQNSDY